MLRHLHTAAWAAGILLTLSSLVSAQTMFINYQNADAPASPSDLPPAPMWQDEASPQADTWQKGEMLQKGECCPPCVGGCCYNPCACWTVSAGALFLQRSQPDDAVLFSNSGDPALATEAINASDYDFGVYGGFEAGVIRHNVWCGYDVEVRGWFIDGWTEGAALTTTGNTFINMQPDANLGFNGGLQVGFGPKNINSTYTSEISSLELNLRHRVACHPSFTWLVGFRALELDENLDTTFEDPAAFQPTSGYFVNTRNRLYGVQLGADWDVLNGCRWCVKLYGRAGLYYNAQANNSEFDCDVNDPLSPCLFGAGQNKDWTSFLGETGISARYCVTDHLRLRADYRFLWLSGVALASDQVNNTSPLFFDGIDPNGDVFYHGLFAGAEYTW